MASTGSTDMTQDLSEEQQLRMKVMALPEILTNVLQFLDKKSLRSFRFVSRFWCLHSDYILNQDWSVERGDLSKVLLFPEYTLSDKEQWIIDQFQLSSSSILNLSLGYVGKTLCNALQLQYSGPRPTPHMNSLSSLSVIGLERTMASSRSPTKLESAICDLIRNSPSLKELALAYYLPDTGPFSVNHFLESTGPSLRKLTIQAGPNFENLGILFQLIFDRERKMQNRQSFNLTQSTVLGHSGPTHSDDHLEELVLNTGILISVVNDPDGSFKSIQGQLRIKSLSIIDSIVVFGNSALQELKRNRLLDILRRCPQLEEFRYGFDVSTDYCRSVNHSPDYEVISGDGLTPPTSGTWIWELFRACPNLKKIDLGGSITWIYEHLDEALETHMGQLESIVLWGIKIEPTRPLDTVFRPGVLNRLTELNINGSFGFEGAVPAVLESAPNLKRLLAENVTVRAEDITGYDWACTNLVHLTLNIFVPSDLYLNDRHSTISNTELQILVCQQLGRLTKLRELKLEQLRVENSLLLTMETGLPYLEPLKNSLEILELRELKNNLRRSEEFEWIARHWIHHRHPELHSRLVIKDSLNATKWKSLQSEIKALYEFSTPPRLKKLYGASQTGEVEDRKTTLLTSLWLSKVCPTLSFGDSPLEGVWGLW